MFSFRALGYSFTQGVKSIQRNKLFSMATIATMSACIFLFGILYFVMANVRFVLYEAESNVGITVFFDEDITEEEIKEIGEKISDIQGVSNYEYLNADETWERYKREYLNEELVATFSDDNPLEHSMSYTVYFDDVKYESDAAEQIKDIDGVRKVNDSNRVVKTLTKINRALSIGTVIIVGLLLAIAAFLISTTITTGVSIRQREISIMHLIGASDFFIRGPFIVEGFIIGMLGVFIPLSVLYALYYKVIGAVASRFSGIFSEVKFVSINEVFSFILPVSLAMGLGIGVLGSSFTLSKQLKKIRSH
ncbi:MAG: permease-like cell division protein FtsX [Lachnospiraceae bacterium]|nr:permease-like cell division protein FtsX [Lachnospiraceae bacterium]